MKLTNHTKIVLGLPDAISVAPGATVEAPDSVIHNRVVAAWIGKGMLTVDGKAPKAQASEKPESDSGMTKDEIIAELAEHGVTRDKRTNKANLEELLAEVRAEKAKEAEAESEGETEAE